MKHLLILLCCVGMGCTSIQPGHVQNNPVQKSLVPVCQERTVEMNQTQCSYQMCQYRLNSYSNTVIALIPKHLKKDTVVRIHLHGFSQQEDGSPFNEKYDVRLRNGIPVEPFDKTINAYGMTQTVCGSSTIAPQILIMPMSFYRCDDYKNSFKTQDDLNAFIAEVELKLKHPIGERQLILSGHSGGGTHLSRILNEADRRIGQLIIYDGLYDGSDPILNWIKLNPTLKVDFVTLYREDGAEGEPYGNANRVIQGLSSPENSFRTYESRLGEAHLTVDEVDTQMGGRIRNFYEKSDPALDHWGLVTAFWTIN